MFPPSRCFLLSIALLLFSFYACSTGYSQQDSDKKKSEEKEFSLWRDSSGKHTVLAKFVNLDRSKVFLEKQDNSIITLPLSKLSRDCQKRARDLKVEQKIAVSFNELKEYESNVALASEAVELYKKFIGNQFAKADEVVLAKSILENLKELAAKSAVRVNGKYLTIDETRKLREETLQVVVSAMEKARAGAAKDAFKLLNRAEKQDDTSIMASYILGMSYMSLRDYSKAKASFYKCFQRGNRFQKIFPEQNLNLSGAMQNIATIKMRESEFNEAVDLYRTSVKLDPKVLGCVLSNLKNAAKLIQIKRLNGGSSSVTLLEKSIAEFTPNGSAATSAAKGWCYVTLKSGNSKIDSYGASGQIQVGQRSAELDNSCLHCNGLGHVDCSNRKCSKGSVRVPKLREIQTGGQTQIQRIFTAEECDTCSGKGRLECPVCKGSRKDSFFGY